MKKVILLIIIIALVISAVVYYLLVINNKTSVDKMLEAQSVKDCRKLDTDLRRDFCIYNILGYKGIATAEDCLEIKTQLYRNECFMLVARNTQNDKLCLNIIDDESLKKRCDIVASNGLPEDCFTIQDKGDLILCISSLAELNKDSEICNYMPEKIKQADYSLSCFIDVSVIKKDINICDLMEKYTVDEFQGVITTNIDVCKRRYNELIDIKYNWVNNIKSN